MDLGFAKQLPWAMTGMDGRETQSYKSYTMCGTPEYMAPELLSGHGHDQCIDNWALGCLAFELAVGRTPFAHSGDAPTAIFRRIARCRGGPQFPEAFDSKAGYDGAPKAFVKRLVVRDPHARLGATATERMRDDPYFDGLDFAALEAQTLDAPWKPDPGSNVAPLVVGGGLKKADPYAGDAEPFEEW